MFNVKWALTDNIKREADKIYRKARKVLRLPLCLFKKIRLQRSARVGKNSCRVLFYYCVEEVYQGKSRRTDRSLGKSVV